VPVKKRVKRAGQIMEERTKAKGKTLTSHSDSMSEDMEMVDVSKPVQEPSQNKANTLNVPSLDTGQFSTVFWILILANVEECLAASTRVELKTTAKRKATKKTKAANDIEVKIVTATAEMKMMKKVKIVMRPKTEPKLKEPLATELL
ncbi:hypothetical protein V5O48_018939, partial [Marasmius crinis-equi]